MTAHFNGLPASAITEAAYAARTVDHAITLVDDAAHVVVVVDPHGHVIARAEAGR